MGVCELTEGELGVGLGALGRDDFSDRPWSLGSPRTVCAREGADCLKGQTAVARFQPGDFEKP